MFSSFLNDAIKAIGERHSSNEKIASRLIPLKSSPSPNETEPLVLSSKKCAISARVAGVDSGFLDKRLSFVDLVFVKTVAVVFDYSNGVVTTTNYHPAPFSFPKPFLLKQGLEGEEQQSVSLVRLREEVSCAIETIKKFKPKYMFLDGSIIPQYKDKPAKESALGEDYHSIISLFEKLYFTAETNSCTLVACVEDSKGTRLIQLLRQFLPKVSFLESSFDASLMDFVLLPMERTFAFPYADSSIAHPILKDYSKQWSESVFAFYIKAAPLDRPLRVEFLCKDKSKLKEIADEISSVVYSLSSLHKEYSFPSILIEADLRAGLSEQEVNVVYERLIDRLGSKITMRRNNRPFG